MVASGRQRVDTHTGLVANSNNSHSIYIYPPLLRIVRIMKVDFCNFNQCDTIYTTTCFVNTLDDHYNHIAYKLLRGEHMDVDWCVHVAIFLVVGTSSSSDLSLP